MSFTSKSLLATAVILLLIGLLFIGCPAKRPAIDVGDAAARVYVPPGSYDEFYAFMSGGFSGQVNVMGLPSGRMFKILPVFSVYPENGYGYYEETKALLNTSYGHLPWDDAHHPLLSQTNGVYDGRWLFINANNTPRVARLDLKKFETVEILEIPHSAGNHASSYITENSEYIVGGTRFSVPIPQADVPISSYKENFNGTLSFVSIDQQTGKMNLAFQILVPGYNYDLASGGKGPSHGWVFFTSYNTEEAHTLLEVTASRNDKDFIAAVNWKRAEECLAQGAGRQKDAEYYHNYKDPETRIASSEVKRSVTILDPDKCEGVMYFLPTPKSPHGVDVDPTGEYIAAGGKLATVIPVHSFSNMMRAIENREFEGDVNGIPVLKYEATIAGEVQNPGLGPLHTEFDGKGYAYTSAFISSEIVKWELGTWEVVDRIPVYYSIGHLLIPGGNTRQPDGKYVVALNKITKDRYIPTGPELCQSAQLIDIDGDRMRLLLDFPLIGEPHYAQAIRSDILMPNVSRMHDLQTNKHPHLIREAEEAKVVRNGNEVRIYMTAVRSHFTPDNIEGIRVGDKVYFHITNIEQEWDIPHGFAIIGDLNPNILIMPGETKTIIWEPQKPGVYPFYCTDFCSALHQEMQGYIRVSPRGSDVPLKYGTGDRMMTAR
jgi:nitrous-oxide reductase